MELSNLPEFVPFAKIARLNREVIVTEKIDGTNACVYVGPDGAVAAGSRSRWITPSDDNFGFARWVAEHEAELRMLGPGTHHGEWWGSGIQRGYDLPKGEKRFSLFNTSKWGDDAARPACCYVVPVIGTFPSLDNAAQRCVQSLRATGSLAAPGFMRPEGIVIFHTHSNSMFKVTLEKDEEPKGASR